MPENRSQQPTAAEFSLGTSANYFGLLWGSIDDYNTLEFLLDGAVVDSYVGLDITDPADGNQSSPGTHTYVNFFGLPEFNGIRMTRSQYAFESDNHASARAAAPSRAHWRCSARVWWAPPGRGVAPTTADRRSDPERAAPGGSLYCKTLIGPVPPATERGRRGPIEPIGPGTGVRAAR